MPASILEPTDPAMAGAMLAEASGRQQLVRPRGAGTKVTWHDDTREAIDFSTRQLNSPVQHFSGDLVATIPAGATLAHANAVLAEAGQWLPLDPSFADCATIGGIVATNDSGPRRHKYGAPRDLIIGVDLALCDGRLAKAGGRVVKNVAGYDLSRLVCGSFGSLAVITSATFKLAPRPQTSRTVVANGLAVPEASRLALEIGARPMTPSAVELAAPAGQLLVRFETTERSADHMAASTCAMLKASGASAAILDGPAEQQLWKNHESSIWNQPGHVVKLSVLPTEVASVVEWVGQIAASADWSAVGRAALGVLLIRVNERDAFANLTDFATNKSGTMSILRGRPVANQRQPNAALRAVMNAIKVQFDPTGILPDLP